MSIRSISVDALFQASEQQVQFPCNLVQHLLEMRSCSGIEMKRPRRWSAMHCPKKAWKKVDERLMKPVNPMEEQ